MMAPQATTGALDSDGPPSVILFFPHTCTRTHARARTHTHPRTHARTHTQTPVHIHTLSLVFIGPVRRHGLAGARARVSTVAGDVAGFGARQALEGRDCSFHCRTKASDGGDPTKFKKYACFCGSPEIVAAARFMAAYGFAWHDRS